MDLVKRGRTRIAVGDYVSLPTSYWGTPYRSPCDKSVCRYMPIFTNVPKIYRYSRYFYRYLPIFTDILDISTDIDRYWPIFSIFLPIFTDIPDIATDIHRYFWYSFDEPPSSPDDPKWAPISQIRVPVRANELRWAISEFWWAPISHIWVPVSPDGPNFKVQISPDEPSMCRKLFQFHP